MKLIAKLLHPVKAPTVTTTDTQVTIAVNGKLLILPIRNAVMMSNKILNQERSIFYPTVTITDTEVTIFVPGQFVTLSIHDAVMMSNEILDQVRSILPPAVPLPEPWWGGAVILDCSSR